MSKNLIARFTPEYMAKIFTSLPAFTAFLQSLSYERALHYSKTFSGYAEEGKEKNVHEADLAELEEINRDLPHLKATVENLQAGSTRRLSIERTVLNMENRKLVLQNRVKNVTPYETAQDALEVERSEATVIAIDALADHVGAWFETGAIGPGTVEFNGKTFTAS